MNPDLEIETRLRMLPLDDTLLELHPKEEAFFKSETGIQDTEELRNSRDSGGRLQGKPLFPH